MNVLEYLKMIGIEAGDEIEEMKEPIINLDAITLEDCIELFVRKGKETVINDGHITDIVYPGYTEKN